MTTNVATPKPTKMLKGYKKAKTTNTPYVFLWIISGTLFLIILTTTFRISR